MSIYMKDTYYPLSVKLVYRIYKNSDIIDRYSVVTNNGENPATLESILSATWYLPRRKGYRLTHLSGSWAREYQIEQLMLTQTKVLLETRRGTSGPDANSVFFLDEDGEANEEYGKVWFGGVHWSGNWKIAIEKNRYNQVKISGGINDFDFCWQLKQGEAFESPVFSGGYTDKGFGDATRILHDYQKDYLLTPEKAKMVMPVLLNVFGTLRNNIDEEKLMKLPDYARNVGVELFVVDAGWHGFSSNVHENLGDWDPHVTRFPNGLKPLIEKVTSLGMDFGIWMEPEMTNTNSHLFKEHPDWILRFKNREGTYAFHRRVLNLARDDVKEFVYGTIYKLLSENNIKYFKIDNNRYITEMCWQEADIPDQKSVWVKYVQNFYDIFARLNKAFPKVIFENCASGGGRVDLAMSKYFCRINRSDNQDPLDELKLHEGFSYAYLPKMAGGGCHISALFSAHINNRVTPMRYQAHTAMLGSLAIGENLYECSSEKLDELKGYVELYKDIREVVHLGQIYRLVTARENPYAVFEYVSKDKKRAVLFVLGKSMQFRDVLPRIRFRGLDPDAVYDVEGYKSMSGKGLMESGLQVKLEGDFDSKVIRIWAQGRN